jgi:hypothetical protein
MDYKKNNMSTDRETENGMEGKQKAKHYLQYDLTDVFKKNSRGKTEENPHMPKPKE